MNVTAWKLRNTVRKVKTRLRYPPPFYKRVGTIDIVVNRADGTTQNLGRASVSYAKRWGVSAK